MLDRLLREILYGVLVRRCFFVLLIGARDLFFYFDFVPNNAKNFRGFVFSSVSWSRWTNGSIATLKIMVVCDCFLGPEYYVPVSRKLNSQLCPLFLCFVRVFSLFSIKISKFCANSI